jgi:hypothetical protein
MAAFMVAIFANQNLDKHQEKWQKNKPLANLSSARGLLIIEIIMF